MDQKCSKMFKKCSKKVKKIRNSQKNQKQSKMNTTKLFDIHYLLLYQLSKSISPFLTVNSKLNKVREMQNVIRVVWINGFLYMAKMRGIRVTRHDQKPFLNLNIRLWPIVIRIFS